MRRGVDLSGIMKFRANSGVTHPELFMNTGKALSAQLMDFLPWTTFARIVQRHGCDCYVKSLACTRQFRPMREGLTATTCFVLSTQTVNAFLMVTGLMATTLGLVPALIDICAEARPASPRLVHSASEIWRPSFIRLALTHEPRTRAVKSRKVGKIRLIMMRPHPCRVFMA